MEEILDDVNSEDEVDNPLGSFYRTDEEAEFIWSIDEVLSKSDSVVTHSVFQSSVCDDETNWYAFLKHSPKDPIPIVFTLVHFGISQYKMIPSINVKFIKRDAQTGNKNNFDVPSIYATCKKTEFKAVAAGDLEVYEFYFKKDDDDIPNFNHLIRKVDYALNIYITVKYSLLDQNPLDNGEESRLGPHTNLEDALEQDADGDLEICTTRRRYFVARKELSTRSEYFFTLWKIDHNVNVIEIKDVKSKAVHEMLRYLYTGKVHSIGEHVYDLLELADRYQIMVLTSKCEKELMKRLTYTNMEAISIAAERYNLADLKKKIIENIMSSIKDGFKKQAGKDLVKQIADTIYKVIAQVPEEEEDE